MNKEEIIEILGSAENIAEHENGSSLIISILTADIDVYITVTYQVHELYYEAKDKHGNTLVNDWHDFYGDMEVEDFKESLLDIFDVIKSPEFRVANNGKAIEAYGLEWYYFFGEFSR